MHDETEARARPGGGPLQHLQVAIGIAEGSERTVPALSLDADRYSRLVVHQVDFGQLHQHRDTVTKLVPELATAPDYLLRRDAVHLLGPGSHELDPAAGHDEGLEAVGPEVGEQLKHGLIHHF